MSIAQSALGLALGVLVSALALARWLPQASAAQELALFSTLKESAVLFRTENCASLAPLITSAELEAQGVITPRFSQGRFDFWIETRPPRFAALAIRQPSVNPAAPDPDAAPQDPGPLLARLRAQGALAHPALANTVLVPLNMRRPSGPDFEITVLSETGGESLCG